ncbi:putative GTP cyclohydrolase 1 type 2 [Emericellopsis cladophorae]|uniref:ATP phosphoribosyltransferase n=1 Tax=Emericellopsis cladophorae TaxID=2686198 RepID=A0A9P9XY39_9HYPO|nr:putative GTP cyclohydrolase 1 type 2 [Emericellopsis cladophorae]KAI6780009.1 putative GTP cyclohydrolase 1 type 2 [Emericellopsis cladophorae]
MSRYVLTFFTPPPSLAVIKRALFATGAGQYPNYAECCFVTPGTGSFRPTQGAHPTIGTVGAVEQVDELRVEVVCKGDVIKAAVAALKESHPYEEVAYYVTKLEDF